LRQLIRAPGFTLTAVLTLAIGIGGVTAVFSVVLAVLLRPLPFKDSGQLISLHEHIEGVSHGLNVTAPDLLTFERATNAFTAVGGFVGSGYELTGAGAPFKARAERVTASLFPLLGIDPMLGRTFTRQEDDDASPVVVISYALWKDRFHGDPNVLRTTVDLDRRPYAIIGVMPRSFEFPLDAGRLSHRDLWVPMSFTAVEKKSEGNNFDFSAIARLKPGIAMPQAQQDVDRVMAGIQAQYLSVAAKNGAILAGPAWRPGRFSFGLFLAGVALVSQVDGAPTCQPGDVSAPTTSARVVLVVLPKRPFRALPPTPISGKRRREDSRQLCSIAGRSDP
jgi:putative ABC transport system permease protein